MNVIKRRVTGGGLRIRTGVLVSLPILDYGAGYQLQRRLCEERITERRDNTLVLVEHEAVVTLGRTTQAIHWQGNAEVLKRQGIKVLASERGGLGDLSRAWPDHRLSDYPASGVLRRAEGLHAFVGRLPHACVGGLGS